MPTWLVVLISWVALSIGIGVALGGLIHLRRERDRLLADNYERLRALHEPPAAPAESWRDADQHPHRLP